MRLRYLHLPRYGPLTDTTVVFGREDRLTQYLNPPRKGALNFVVGVNGSGKSSLLRAIYRIFRALKANELPAMPLTLAWDIFLSRGSETAVLHVPVRANEKPWFVVAPLAQPDTGKANWSYFVEKLSDERNTLGLEETTKRGEAVLGSFMQAFLPKRLIAYTSGADDLWVQLDHPDFHPAVEGREKYQIEDERPPGWSMDREWEEEQPKRISNVLASSAIKSSLIAKAIPGTPLVGQMTEATLDLLGQELRPLEIMQQKVVANRMSRAEQLDDSYFRIQARHLRIAGITLALWQTAMEMNGRTEEDKREALRSLFLQHLGCDGITPTNGRHVLNKIDWFWPTHLSLTYHDDADRVSPRQHQELLCLVALADEVIAQPLGRKRAIFSLGPSDRISLTEKLKDAFPLGIPNKAIEFIAERVDGCKTGAEAILRILSADKDIKSTPMDVFSRLRDWERTGLLEDLTLTIKRIHRPKADGEPDDTLVTYDQLSDGEQMLLGRMGLLFLLRGQNGSLLLLDEPETHFNDVWKREIVEMVDLGLLNSTEANVIVATHTSIALTDAFAAEVTVLDKNDGHTTARGVTGGLFGTDPGEVTMNLFRADSSIGSRSVEILDQLLKTEWKGRETELEDILNVLGSSFHRAELRAILKQLRTPSHGITSG